MAKKKPQDKETMIHDEFALLEWFRHIALAASYGILFLFLVTNILLSQVVPDLYTEIFQGKKEAVVELFKRGRNSSYFMTLIPESRRLFAQYESEIYEEEHARRELINGLESLLESNPKSRDILYSLYLLYDKDGNDIVAQEYLQKAREIDPQVGK